MLDFIINGTLWVLALYGLYEIIRNIIYAYTYTNLKADGIYMIIATKNQEENIEGFIRSLVFRCLYGKEEVIKNVMIADLASTDNTKKILLNLEKDYETIKVIDWKECKELMDNITII